MEFFSPQPKPSRKKSKKTREKARKDCCEYCGKYGSVEVHHIKSKGSGGQDTPENLVSLCGVCHTKVHNGEIEKAELQALKEG